MIFRETALKGAYVIEPERKEDDRGFFARTWCRRICVSGAEYDTRSVQYLIQHKRGHCGACTFRRPRMRK